MHILANNKQVVEGTIALPRAGVWTANLSLNSTDAVTGAVQITIANGEMVFKGTALVGEPVNGRTLVRVVGGGGGLGQQVTGKSHTSVPARIPITDLLAAVGESVDSASDAPLLDLKLHYWCRAAGTAKRELRFLADRIGASWRVLPNGNVWVGTETWPATQLRNAVVLEDRPEENRVVIAADIPAIYPGETYRSGHVVTVTHQINGSTLRTTITLEAS